jgi:hypothetical protein
MSAVSTWHLSESRTKNAGTPRCSMQILEVLKSIAAAVHRKLDVLLVKEMDVFFIWNRIE